MEMSMDHGQMEIRLQVLVNRLLCVVREVYLVGFSGVYELARF